MQNSVELKWYSKKHLILKKPLNLILKKALNEEQKKTMDTSCQVANLNLSYE